MRKNSSRVRSSVEVDEVADEEVDGQATGAEGEEAVAGKGERWPDEQLPAAKSIAEIPFTS